MTATALVLICLGACKSPTANDPPRADAKTEAAGTADQGSGFVQQTTGGSYLVSINPPPSRMPLNELFELHIRVLDAGTKKPAAGVSVSGDAAMPTHRHGMNTAPRTAQNPDGSFTTRGMMLHMPGYWEVYVDVTRNGQTERAVIEVELD